jgi:hypothetical protein
MAISVELIRRDSGAVNVVNLAGMADGTAIVDVVEALRQVEPGSTPVIIDFGAVEFLNMRALSDLLDSLELLDETGRVRLVCGTFIGRALERRCRASRLPVFTSMRDALAHISESSATST